MKFIAFFLGFILLAEGWNRKVAQAELKLEKLQELLLELSKSLEHNDGVGRCSPDDEDMTKDWLKKVNETYRYHLNKVTVADWNYDSDIREETRQKMNKADVKFTAFVRKLGEQAGKCIPKDPNSFSPDVLRQLKLLNRISSPTDHRSVEKMNEIQSDLTEIYATATVNIDGHEEQIEPGLNAIMANSRAEPELRKAWEGWRAATGAKMRGKFERLVKFQNKGATDNGYSSMADVWIEGDFDEIEGVEEMCDDLWNQLKPMYTDLHTYVYRKLKEYYSNYTFPEEGVIPAHLLGNMWAQQWDNIYDIVQPFQDVTEENYDSILKEMNYTPRKMFDVAEQFYSSIGLYNMTDTFWEKSIIVKPPDRDLVCHASAWDFYKEDDFRIKMCTNVTMDYFETIHHEMGHIEYYMAYRHQPAVYRRGANGGFHEAVGDTIALSVRTPKHLNTLLNVSSSPDINKSHSDLNYLMRKALIKLAFLPFGYLIDKWRWSVFRNETTPDHYNSEWWRMRKEYQMIGPPSPRNESFFDPGAKYHVTAGVPYIRYFISFIVQFQFYEAMCVAAGHGDKPLHECDFYQSKEAGELLRQMLALGGEKPWREALKVMTGNDTISADAIKKYFKPLTNWLREENKKSI